MKIKCYLCVFGVFSCLFLSCSSFFHSSDLNSKTVIRQLKKVIKLSSQEVTILEKALEIYKDSIGDIELLVFTQLDASMHGFQTNGISIITSNEYHIFCNIKDGSIKLYPITSDNLANKISQAVKNKNITHLKEYAAKASQRCSHCGIIVIVYREGKQYKREVISEFYE